MADNIPAPFGFADEPDEPHRGSAPSDRSPRPKKKAAKPREAGRKSKPQNQASLLWLLVMVVPLIGLAVFMAIRQVGQRSAEQQAFAAEMDQLAAPPAAGPVKVTPGKLAIIDVDKRELHSLHHRNGGTGAELQAATPQEAVTIVHLRVTNREMLEYLNGRKGVKQTFHLTVIDKATWKKIDEKSFEGGDPPEWIRIKGDPGELVTGPAPTADIFAYLQKLCGG